MMVATKNLVTYLNELMQPERFKDYCPNGLQIAGVDTIKKIITGVSANQALINVAVAEQADAILVHHGFFWKGEDPCIVGIKRHRFTAILENNINVIAYHLPLDAHPEFGNNKQLADKLAITVEGQISCGEQPALSWYGELDEVLPGEQLCLRIAERLQRQPLYIPGRAGQIKRVAWCTGAAQDFIEPLAMQSFDAFITGEVSERTVSIARETGIHFYAAGHHATERYGVKALGELLAQKFTIACEFVDIDNPV